MKLKSLVCLVLCPLLVLSARAAESVPLETLIQQSLENNPELKFYEAEIAAAKAGRRTAVTLANPEVSAALGDKHVRNAGDGVAWSVSVQQTFEWPGRIPLRKAIANHQVKLAETGLAQFKAVLAARTRAAALSLSTAQEKAAAAREVADRFQALREVLVQRDPAGITPALETRIIEATELTLQRRVSEAAIMEKTALLELNQLRGQPLSSVVRPKAPAADLVALPPTDALIAAALTNNFELQMRRSELEQQGFMVSLAQHERKPAFSVGPYVTQEHGGGGETQFGIGVTVPLPIWNRNTGNVAVAEARRLQAATSLLVLQRQLEREITGQALVHEAKRAEMLKWRPESIEEFRKAADLADRHYRLGAVPVATYVELQKQYLDAVETLLDTRREGLVAAHELQRLTGLDFGNKTAEERK